MKYTLYWRKWSYFIGDILWLWIVRFFKTTMVITSVFRQNVRFRSIVIIIVIVSIATDIIISLITRQRLKISFSIRKQIWTLFSSEILIKKYPRYDTLVSIVHVKNSPTLSIQSFFVNDIELFSPVSFSDITSKPDRNYSQTTFIFHLNLEEIEYIFYWYCSIYYNTRTKHLQLKLY